MDKRSKRAPARSPGFRWQPGTGPDPQTLARMAQAAPKPSAVMGEAWFMNDERKMYGYLGTTAVEHLSDNQINETLWDIASGTSSFGHMDEWDAWFAYLLPRLIGIKQAPAQRSVIEMLATAFFIHYPVRIDDWTYDDVLQTLGQVIMGPSRWKNGRLILDHFFNGPPNSPDETWGWWDVCSDLSVSLFFCLKYLDPRDIEGWVDSIFAIDDPHWRAQILLWLGLARKIWDAGSAFPADLGDRTPQTKWSESFLLDARLAAPFITEENRCAFKDAMRPLLALHLDDWRQSIAQVDYLELEALPSIIDIDDL
ncbi:hypothetical protein [Massilia pseudoviolaceinigra]|uniref:hypothetical protein n=1 Tax=Massilia pseudoviolaceinigra TaxID=3057165 RepID=UPI0027964284|nr:hypothetical protein [Massilia sp. CCM 9206]MDQ1922236.1 hypothetical protein [Massilia sp. CCM 9206]